LTSAAAIILNFRQIYTHSTYINNSKVKSMQIKPR